MTLTQLQAFLAAATVGTFTRAAQSLKMSQPAVSDLVRRLEAELGSPLFHRGARSLTLTDAGTQLLPYAKRTIAAADLGKKAVRSQLELDDGTATFGLLRNAGFYLHADLAAAFHARYPRVRIRLIGQNSAEIAADIAAGILEAGLVTLPVADDGLEVVPLARDEILLATVDPARVAKPTTIDEFVDRPHVLYDAHYSDTDPARRQLLERAQLAGRMLDPIIEVEYLSSALALVAAAIGDTILCRAAAMSDVVPPEIRMGSFAEPMFNTLALAKRRGQALSPATRELAWMAWAALLEHQSTAHGTTEIIARQEQLDRFFNHP